MISGYMCKLHNMFIGSPVPCRRRWWLLLSSIIVEYLHILRTVPSAVAILYQVYFSLRPCGGWLVLVTPPPTCIGTGRMRVG